MNGPGGPLGRLAEKVSPQIPSALFGPPEGDPSRRVVRHRPPAMRIHQIASAPIRPRARQPPTSTLRLLCPQIHGTLHMNPLLEARRAMRLAITELESACWSLERYGIQMNPDHTTRRGILAAQTALQSIDWSALNELYIAHRANSAPATDRAS